MIKALFLSLLVVFALHMTFTDHGLAKCEYTSRPETYNEIKILAFLKNGSYTCPAENNLPRIKIIWHTHQGIRNGEIQTELITNG